MSNSYYDILGIQTDATEVEIRRAYRRMAKLFHPDVNKAPDAEQQFLKIKNAYDVLLNGSNSNSYHQRYQKPMSSYDSYMVWKRRQREKAEEEARIRFQEFLKNKEELQQSVWYYPLYLFMYIATGFCYLLSAGIILLSAYVIQKTHIVVVFLMLPLISGAIFLMKRTSGWYKEAKKFF
jgi:hypothetical protein